MFSLPRLAIRDGEQMEVVAGNVKEVGHRKRAVDLIKDPPGRERAQPLAS
jgi:hypothetical protein